MRGRSNLSGGASINGTEVDKVVAPNKTVVKGSFVEYYTVKHSTNLEDANITKSIQYDVNRWLALSQNYLYMFKIENGVLVIESTFSAYQTKDFVKSGNDIVVACGTVVVALGYNNGFVQKSTIGISASAFGIACIGDYVITTSGVGSSVLTYNLISYTSSTLELVDTYSQNPGRYLASNIYTISLDTKVYTFNCASNTTTIQVYINELSEGVLTGMTTIECGALSVSGVMTRPMIVNGHIGFVKNDIARYSTPKFVLFNVDTFSTSLFDFRTAGISFSENTSYFTANCINDDNVFVCSDSKRVFLCKYNVASNSISLYSNIFKLEYNHSGTMEYGILGDSYICISQMYDDVIAVVHLNDDMTIISDYPDENYVQPYSTGLNTMGVAKHSGNAGDTITVIVP